MNPLVAGSNPAGRIFDASGVAAGFLTPFRVRLFEFHLANLLMSRANLIETSATVKLPGRKQLRTLVPNLIVHGVTVTFCLLHCWAIWLAMEGWAGLTNGWPLWKHDHPLYMYSAIATRSFFSLNGTTAGYDPGFMSGFAKSAVFPASSTLPEVVIALFGGTRPEVAYKLYVLISCSLVVWLVYAAAAIWRLGAFGQLLAVFVYLFYLWTDFPVNYPIFGMVPYFLAIPLGLMVTGAFARYCERGGFFLWLATALLFVFVVLIHFTSAMVVAPAAILVYGAALVWGGGGPAAFSGKRHAGVWLIPLIVIVLNAFWWLPGVFLASTKGASDFAFVHREGVLVRLGHIFTNEPKIELFLLSFGTLGLALQFRHQRVSSAPLIGFVTAGFFWGYLAGGVRGLDFLQPGRHTYAFYTGLSLSAGFGLERIIAFVSDRTRLRWDVILSLTLVLGGGWYSSSILLRLATEGVKGNAALLTSRPTPTLMWVFSRIKRHVPRGQRLLYEEGGFKNKQASDPYGDGRFSGFIPPLLGVEVIGGPYLHAALTTNFTQFGEGRLFGRLDWDRDWFVRYARIYRPDAILCWSPRAREFCRMNPDLIEIREDNGQLMIGRVKGFEGFASEGKAEVRASTGRLEVVRAEGGVDGMVVLRYHSVPYLRTEPPVALGAVYLEDDPVPFIRFRPPLGPFTIELGFPPGRNVMEDAPKQ